MKKDYVTWQDNTSYEDVWRVCLTDVQQTRRTCIQQSRFYANFNMKYGKLSVFYDV